MLLAHLFNHMQAQKSETHIQNISSQINTEDIVPACLSIIGLIHVMRTEILHTQNVVVSLKQWCILSVGRDKILGQNFIPGSASL